MLGQKILDLVKLGNILASRAGKHCSNPTLAIHMINLSENYSNLIFPTILQQNMHTYTYIYILYVCRKRENSVRVLDE